MAEQRSKKYSIEFKLYDGTTRSVSIEIPLGEDGGYYIPSIENKNGETLIHFTPSSPDMPAMEPITVLNLNEAINMTLTQAKESGEFNGADGAKGDKGDKGDTGPAGPTGPQGNPGKDGKSAYQYALDGGYTGTEEEFAQKLASETSGGTSVQADWNQFEDTAADFIKNRTHYEGYNSVKFDGEIMLSDTGEAEIASIGLVVGQQYTVQYGDNIYYTTGIDLTELGLGGFVLIGNASAFGLPGGEDIPFAIMDVPNARCVVMDMIGAVSTSMYLAIVEGNEIGNTTTIEDSIGSVLYFVMVSTRVLTESDLSDGYRIEALVDGEMQIIDPSNSEISTDELGTTITTTAEGYPVVIGLPEDDAEMGLLKGTYFIDSLLLPTVPFRVATKSLTVYKSTLFAKRIEHKRLDPKFLPENIVLASPSGKQFNITVDDSGALMATEVVE